MHFCYKTDDIGRLRGILKYFKKNGRGHSVSISAGRFDEVFNTKTRGEWHHGGPGLTASQEWLEVVKKQSFNCDQCKHKLVCLIDPNAEVLYEE